MTPQVVDRSLFAEIWPPCLAGSRCAECGTTAFPHQAGCPRCGSATSTVPLPRRGTVWSWTVQCYQPKPPYRAPAEGFSPYAVGYVDLGDVLVESRLEVPHDLLRIGLPVRLALVPAWQEEDGTETVTYAFVPDLSVLGLEEAAS
ncbi:Zn-ribbon domain-containing OB-fold protein [Nonomuraea sp. NPDC049480]|uniref:Zn-ribbon domain-containing OB-fold protein n=1 Tax=Nonomuraea sp. NPDC049480 TaxID=3364353 RepID=UPI003793A3C0